MKFIVAQIGARHHYAIPRMLARRQCLEALYTDSCSNRGVGRLLNHITPVKARRGALGSLLQRQVVGVPQERIYVTDRLLWARVLQNRPADTFADSNLKGTLFSRQMVRWGTKNATHLYSMFGEGLEFLRQAKGKGLKICVDVFITPVAHRIIFEERKLFPEWEGEAIAWNSQLELRVAAILEMADLLICPGRNVVDGIAEFGMEVASKIRVVPYGSGTDFAGRLNEPIVGRVLFAGTAELRKGIHYFAAAAHELGTAGYDFRVAGGVTDRITKLPACDSLRFLGRISRSEMADEILTADVLVLPTLAEGSASVVSEALVAGLPVITTSSAGSSVIHDNSGLLVRERDCQDLASAINRVVSDRPFRRHLALGARSQARFLTEQEWEKRLIIALGEVTDRLEGK